MNTAQNPSKVLFKRRELIRVESKNVDAAVAHAPSYLFNVRAVFFGEEFCSETQFEFVEDLCFEFAQNRGLA